MASTASTTSASAGSSANSLCVFCGSSPGTKPEYMAAAASVGSAIARRQWRLVYGGGSRGCMSGVSNAVIQEGGRVLGVIPAVMVNERPNGHPGAPAVSKEGQGPEVLDLSSGPGTMETVVVDSMHQRKAVMSRESDLGFVALPGGYGTFEEVMEMVTWTQLGIHNKPMVLLNINGFWSPIRQMVEHAVEEGFISEAGKQLIRFVDVDAAHADSCGQQVLDEVVSMQQAMAQRGGGYWNWEKKEQQGAGAGAVARGNGQASGASDAMDVDEVLAVEVPDLTFSFRPDLAPALEHCNLKLRKGSRCLLIGANGAGKSTLLRLLAGKRLCDSKARVFGKDVFRESPSGITYLGTEWAMNPVVRSDIVVSHFLNSVGGYRHKERRDRLLDILDVDLNWHMHAISDGERRRVQLCMGLMEPWDLLLLDEVTVDLDVQVRADLLDFLTQETVERNATIIYATHIFDGLQGFPTHVAHMRMGTTVDKEPISWPPSSEEGLPPTDETDKHRDLSPLLSISLAWLRKDKTLRGEAEEKRGRRRGAAKDDGADQDSERFFSKYDYSQTVNR